MLRRTATSRSVLVTVVLVLALALGACSGGDELVVYSGRSQSLVGPLLEQFAEDRGIPIAVRYGDSAELALLLEQEGEASDADVVFMQTPGAVAFLGDGGRLATLDDTLVDQVDPSFASDNDRWVGITGRQRVLVYNTDLVDDADLPASVFDLTDPVYRARVGVAPSNGSFQDFVSAMRLAIGDDDTRRWLEGLVANDAATYPNNNAIVEAVGRGEIDMGLVNHYYNYRFLAEDPGAPSANHGFAAGDLGNLVIVSAAAVVDGTDQPEWAREFVDYLLSEPAQRYFSDDTFEYPLASGVQPSSQLPALDPAELPQVDIDALGEDLDTTVELIQDSGLAS
jgi:iron(III) transport system substrate-binding protein